MKITFRQSGGFTGVITGTEIDTDTMVPDQAHQIEQMVANTLLHRTPPSPSDARDVPQYDITVEQDGNIKQANFTSSDVDESLRPLLRYLKQHAEPRPPE